MRLSLVIKPLDHQLLEKLKKSKLHRPFPHMVGAIEPILQYKGKYVHAYVHAHTHMHIYIHRDTHTRYRGFIVFIDMCCVFIKMSSEGIKNTFTHIHMQRHTYNI
jgi:hypothetical protein